LVGQRVWHMAFTPDEKYLLTTNGVSNDVSVIDVAAQKVIKTIQVGEMPWGGTISPRPNQTHSTQQLRSGRTFPPGRTALRRRRCRLSASAIPMVRGVR